MGVGPVVAGHGGTVLGIGLDWLFDRLVRLGQDLRVFRGGSGLVLGCRHRLGPGGRRRGNGISRRQVCRHRRLRRLLGSDRHFVDSRQGFGMFGLDLTDRGIELVELALKHVFGRARRHVLKLPNDSGTGLFIDPYAHLRSVVREPVYGPSNYRDKVCHQHFLLRAGPPGRQNFIKILD